MKWELPGKKETEEEEGEEESKNLVFGVQIYIKLLRNFVSWS